MTRIPLTDEDISITEGEDDPLVNGIVIETGCLCDGYSCDDKCKIKKEQLKKQILDDYEFCKKHDKIYETRQAPFKKRPTELEQKLEQENKQLKEELEKQVCQSCKRSYPDTVFPACDGENLCQECFRNIEKNKEIVQKVRECLDNINSSEIDSVTVDIINELEEILGDREGAKEYNDI